MIENFTLFQFLSLIISFVALSTSIYSLWLNRKKLNVAIEDELGDIDDIYLSYSDYQNKNVSLNFGEGKVCFIKIVNPSPKDISFFDFSVIDIATDTLLFFITKSTLDSLGLTNSSLFVPINNENLAKLNYPDSTSGILKSNSFNRLDIAFFPQNKTSKIKILFKVAIYSHSFKHNGQYRKNFKTFSKTFNVDL